MCNPRRVMIHVNRSIEQAWQTSVEQAARTEGEVRERARLHVDIPLAAEMGERALAMLERVVQGEFGDYQPWTRDHEGNYRRDLGAVTLVYRPGARDLIVEAALTEQISAEARAAAEASGFTVGEVATEAVGHYYDDGWGGYTEERARRDAEAEAERALATAIENLHRQQHAAELEAAETEARARAETRAAAELERVRTEMRQALRRRLQGILTESRDVIRHTVNRLVGETYSQTLMQVAWENGGRIVSDRRSGSVIDLELEL